MQLWELQSSGSTAHSWLCNGIWGKTGGSDGLGLDWIGNLTRGGHDRSAIESISHRVRVASSRNACVCANVCLGINASAKWFVYYFLWSVFVWHAITFWQATATATATSIATTTKRRTSRRVHIESSWLTPIGINNGSHHDPPMSGYRAAPGHLQTLTSGPGPAILLPLADAQTMATLLAAARCSANGSSGFFSAKGGSRCPQLTLIHGQAVSLIAATIVTFFPLLFFYFFAHCQSRRAGFLNWSPFFSCSWLFMLIGWPIQVDINYLRKWHLLLESRQ